MGIYKIKPNARKYSRVANNEFEFCKFPCVNLTRFRLVKKQSASVRTHTCALSWTSPFNEEMTSKMQPATGFLQGKPPLTEKNWGQGWVVLVVKKKMADISRVSGARTAAGTRQNDRKKHGKNSKKTTRRAKSAIWRIFAELDKPNVHYRRWT